MSERNLFDEVKEDLERERFEALWKRYGTWVAGVALAIVIGTGLSTAYRSWHADHNQKVTQALLLAGKAQPDKAQTIAGLEKFADENTGTDEKSLALLHAASVASDSSDIKKAIELYDQVASDPQGRKAFRQLGDLMSVQLQLDTGDASVLRSRLDPLMEEKAPWRFSAMELAAYLSLRMGDKGQAKKLLTELAQDATVPQSIAVRAADLLRSLN